jgi:hypothetical protein
MTFDEWLDFYSPDAHKYFTEGEIKPLRAAWDAAMSNRPEARCMKCTAPNCYCESQKPQECDRIDGLCPHPMACKDIGKACRPSAAGGEE